MSVDHTAFARDWEAAWNAHDLDRILSHYAEDVTFRSQKAAALVGTGVIAGKVALAAYWSKALERQPDLVFTVTGVFRGHEMIVLTYRNHLGVMAAETLSFGADGLVVDGAACHAA